MKTDDEKDDDYLLGQSTGLDEAAGLLLQKSKDAFGRERDQEAKLLRDLSKEIQKIADDRYKHPEV